jgi:hypothetical protein
VRILVTGHRGHIGGPVTDLLNQQGHEVTGFDLADGMDLLDLPAVRDAAARCQAIVHLGALANDSAGRPEQIMAVNVLGTWHVLLAAEAAGVTRVVYFSSAQVFGTAEGERLPDYFPVDDAHPRRAMRPYGLSKVLAEDLCQGFTARTGIVTVALRPASNSRPGSLLACRSPTRSATRPIPGGPSSTPRPPRPPSAGSQPTAGLHSANARASACASRRPGCWRRPELQDRPSGEIRRLNASGRDSARPAASSASHS